MLSREPALQYNFILLDHEFIISFRSFAGCQLSV